ncbi:MAG TPA: GAF domain-containing sensor histidine kinase [Acidimicrobiales bacterium]|nr:GAF domain-containing sensor histidine kinase [Acidimicrobiales bacterium]
MTFHRIDDPKRLHALIDAILMIETDAHLNELLRTIVENAARLVGAKYGALGVVGSDASTLTRFVTYGVDESTRAAIGHNPHGHGVLGETIRRGAPLRVDRLAEHEGSSGFPANHPAMEHFLGVPVITGDGHVYGNLYLTDRLDGAPFDQQDQDLVEGFGRAAGLVIDQATLRHELRELTLSEERERLARDLHDTVIQRLFGVGLALQVTLGAELDEASRARINGALDDLDATIHEIRTTIFEIDQDDFDAGSLEERITTLSEEVGTRLGIDVSLSVAPTINHLVGKNCGRHTVHALREMLSNVARHSQASHATVDVGLDGDHVVVTVSDDGVGFSARVGAGRGLRNLVSRARELGGDCRIDSAPDRGTLVRWTANRLD